MFMEEKEVKKSIKDTMASVAEKVGKQQPILLVRQQKVLIKQRMRYFMQSTKMGMGRLA